MQLGLWYVLRYAYCFVLKLSQRDEIKIINKNNLMKYEMPHEIWLN